MTAIMSAITWITEQTWFAVLDMTFHVAVFWHVVHHVCKHTNRTWRWVNQWATTPKARSYTDPMPWCQDPERRERYQAKATASLVARNERMAFKRRTTNGQLLLDEAKANVVRSMPLDEYLDTYASRIGQGS